jgi:hypothetical protein
MAGAYYCSQLANIGRLRIDMWSDVESDGGGSYCYEGPE